MFVLNNAPLKPVTSMPSNFAFNTFVRMMPRPHLPVKLNLPANLSVGGAGSPLPAVGAHGVTRPTEIVDVSCLSGQGIEALKDAIKELVWSGEINAGMLQVMINSRHQDALNRARASTQMTIGALRGDATLELAAMDLRIAVNAVGEIVGKTATEDLLDSIFSRFCIGK